MDHDDLLAVFREEAATRIQQLGDGLLVLETQADSLAPAEREARLADLNQHAHGLKGAAHAVGYRMVETIAHYLAEIFQQALEQGKLPDAALNDTIYDGLDLIQSRLRGETPDENVVAAVIGALEAQIGAQQPSESSENAHARLRSAATEMIAFTEQPTPTADDELLAVFREEVQDHLTTLNETLLQIEMSADPADEGQLREINRVAHSMKGAARAVGNSLIENISHHMEEVFQACMNGLLTLAPTVTDALYDSLDLIQREMDGEPIQDETLAKVRLQLEQLSENDPVSATNRSAGDAPRREEINISDSAYDATRTTETSGVALTTLLRTPEETLRVSVGKLDQLMADASELLIARMQNDVRRQRLAQLRHEQSRVLRTWRNVRASYVRLVRRQQAQASQASSPELQDLFEFLEVNERHLTRMTRELATLHQEFIQDQMQLTTLADQMQHNVAGLRMMPFDTVVSGFHRVAREIARDLGKHVNLEIIGSSVEIDKTVLDALRDPLLHLLRNAIDHGLEPPDERRRAGKEPSGTVRVLFEQRGGDVTITISDDGRGLNIRKIRERAAQRGLLTTQEAQTISDDEVRMLVFQSGLSTSEQVTSLSGRGLGMDIVRSKVESLRGRVQIESELSKGTTVYLQVPVSLTRIRVITLQVGNERYAIPSTMVERMEMIARDDLYTAEGRTMINLNGQPMPLVSLGETLQVPNWMPPNAEMVPIIALSTTQNVVAFEVDALDNETEVVLKALGHEIAEAPFVAGAALLGTGDVLIVLDVNDLVRHSASGGRRRQTMAMPAVQAPTNRADTRVLVVDDSITTRTLEKNILEAIGFDVYVAIDGEEAWSMIPEVQPHVIVSDVEMPHLNGLDLTRRIRAHRETENLPVILLTSLDKPEQREAGMRSGADAYLIKNQFDQEILLRTVDALL